MQRRSSSSPHRQPPSGQGNPGQQQSHAKPLPKRPSESSDPGSPPEHKTPVSTSSGSSESLSITPKTSSQGPQILQRPPITPNSRPLFKSNNLLGASQITGPESGTPRRAKLERSERIRESEEAQNQTRRAQFNLGSKKGGLLAAPSAQTSSLTRRRFEAFEVTVGPFTFRKNWNLKIDDSKMVIAVKRYGEPWVLKISPGGGLQVQGNVVAGHWIKNMKLRCISAPIMALMGPHDVSSCLTALKLKSPDDAKTIEREILATQKDAIPDVFTGGMMSQQVAPSIDRYAAGLKLGSHTFDRVPNEQALEELATLSNYFNGMFTGKKPFIQALEKGLYDDAAVSVSRKDTGQQTPSEMARFEEAKLRFYFLCEQLGSEAATALLEPVRKHAEPANQLKTWLSTPDGKEAFIMMTCVDLLFGMEDRVLERWHPGNLSFDGSKLLCIDNAKAGPSLVVGASLKENFAEYMGWKQLKHPCLLQHVKEAIMQTQLWGEDPAIQLGGVWKCLSFVLSRAKSSAKLSNDASASVILSRVKYLKALLQSQEPLAIKLVDCETKIHQVLALDLPEKSTSTTSLMKKAARLGLVLKPSIAKAHQAKSALRAATEIQNLSAEVAAAKKTLLQTDSTDQAYAKLKLEVAAGEFVIALHHAKDTAEKVGYLLTPQEQAALQVCVTLWSQLEDSKVVGMIDEIWSAWPGKK